MARPQCGTPLVVLVADERFRNHLLGFHIYYEVIEIQKSFDVKKKYKIFPLNDACKRSLSCKRTCGKQPILQAILFWMI
jgi:hypothetical protein